MFAEAKSRLMHLILHLIPQLTPKRLPLLHQPQPDLLGLFQRHDALVHLVRDLVRQLGRQHGQTAVVGELLAPPVFLLRRYVGGRDDGDVGVYEEQGEDFAVAGL